MSVCELFILNGSKPVVFGCLQKVIRHLHMTIFAECPIKHIKVVLFQLIQEVIHLLRQQQRSVRMLRQWTFTMDFPGCLDMLLSIGCQFQHHIIKLISNDGFPTLSRPDSIIEEIMLIEYLSG